MQFLILVGFFAVIIVLFMTTYILNNKTEKPMDIDMSACGGCHNISCGHNQANQSNKEEN